MRASPQLTINIIGMTSHSPFFPTDTYDIYIAHKWRYDDEWVKLVDLLDTALGTKWRNWSLPWHDPSIANSSENGRKVVSKLMEGQISCSSIVFVLGDLIGGRDRGDAWISLQIEMAKKESMPIIGVRSSSDILFPENFSNLMDKLVDFNQTEIIKSLTASE